MFGFWNEAAVEHCLQKRSYEDSKKMIDVEELQRGTYSKVDGEPDQPQLRQLRKSDLLANK